MARQPTPLPPSQTPIYVEDSTVKTEKITTDRSGSIKLVATAYEHVSE